MKKYSIWVLSIVLIALLSLSLASAQEQIVIKFWSHDYAPREAIDRDIIAQFEADNPNIKVEYTIGPGDDPLYIQQLQVALAGGEGPDLFNVLTLGVPELMSSGAVVPVDWAALGYESQEDLTSRYLDGTLGDFFYEGTLYALPTELGNYSLIINGDLFRAAGLDPVEDAPKTWEDLLALAPVLTVRDDSGNITQRAFDFAYPIPDEIMSRRIILGGMAYQLGGAFLNEDRTAGAVNTEAWVRTYEFVRDWAAEWGGPQYTPSGVAFAEGNVAMVISGAWYRDHVAGTNPEVAEAIVGAPFPRWSEGVVNDAGSYMYAYGLYVNVQSPPEVQEAAWKLANALTTQPERYLSEALLLQPAVAVVENEELMSSSFAALFIADMEGNPFLPSGPGTAELTPILDRALERVLLEGMDVQESLNIANDEITASITNP